MLNFSTEGTGWVWEATDIWGIYQVYFFSYCILFSIQTDLASLWSTPKENVSQVFSNSTEVNELHYLPAAKAWFLQALQTFLLERRKLPREWDTFGLISSILVFPDWTHCLSLTGQTICFIGLELLNLEHIKTTFVLHFPKHSGLEK